MPADVLVFFFSTVSTGHWCPAASSFTGVLNHFPVLFLSKKIKMNVSLSAAIPTIPVDNSLVHRTDTSVKDQQIH